MLATQLNSIVKDSQVKTAVPPVALHVPPTRVFCFFGPFRALRISLFSSCPQPWRDEVRTNLLSVLATISSRALPEWRLSSWQMEKMSIIAVHECICNVVQSRRIVILLNIEV
jgi:hypothetical protein